MIKKLIEEFTRSKYINYLESELESFKRLYHEKELEAYKNKDILSNQFDLIKNILTEQKIAHIAIFHGGYSFLVLCNPDKINYNNNLMDLLIKHGYFEFKQNKLTMIN